MRINIIFEMVTVSFDNVRLPSIEQQNSIMKKKKKKTLNSNFNFDRERKRVKFLRDCKNFYTFKLPKT